MLILPHLLAALTGLTTHIIYFRKGEHHLYPFQYVYTHLLLFAIACYTLHHTQSIPLPSTIPPITLFSLEYLLSLYTSLTIYRLFLHPLRQFPGPKGARLSAFWLSFHLTDRPAFRRLLELHKECGPIVRVGPSELSIAYPDAVAPIYGAKSPCSKSIFYDAGYPSVSLHSLRSRALHDKRRRVWSPGFSDKALHGYEQRVRVYRQRLFEYLEQTSGQIVDVSKWFSYYGFDVTSDLAFARSFNMLISEENRGLLGLFAKGTTPLEYMIPTWFLRLFIGLRFLSRDFWNFNRFCVDCLERRMVDKVDIPDISASLLAPLDGRAPTKEEKDVLLGDTMLIISAGSETTSTTLTTITYELARHPEQADKIRAELQSFPTNAQGEYAHEQIANLPHLNAFIKECMRLYPGAPSAIPRLTPPEGIEVHGVRIPGGMTVYCPQWVIGRSEAAYVDPESFRPERWHERPELVKEPSAFVPFSIGPYSCIGKSLAMINLRGTIARLVMTFDISFRAGVDGARYMLDAGDHFALYVREMPVILRKRELC